VVSALERVFDENELCEDDDEVIVWAGVTDQELELIW
jgi:hypothetical protein